MKKKLLILSLMSICFSFNDVKAQDNVDLLTYFRGERVKTNSLIEKKLSAENSIFLKNYKDVIVTLSDEDVHFETTSDIQANNASNLDDIQTGAVGGFNLKGEGIEIAVFDAGSVLPSHLEFRGVPNQQISRVHDLENGVQPLSSHASSVSGLIAAEGYYDFNEIDGASKGALPKALIKHAGFAQTVNGDRFTKLLQYNKLISNHSYAANNGWTDSALSSLGSGYYYSVNASLFSNPNQTLFGAYYSIDFGFDKLVYANPNFIIVKSAGNDYGKGPGVNDPKFRWTGSGYVPFGPNDIIPDANCGDGAYCISNGSLAKNILIVGSVDLPSSNNGVFPASSIQKASYSSAGPRKDGAIKPDLVAVGTNVHVLTHTGPNWMKISSGTSFSTPVVTGAIGALTQLKRLLNNNSQSNFRADEIKALLVHTTIEAGNFEGPDNWHGWGLLDAKKAAEVFLSTHNGNDYLEKNTKISGVDYQKVVVAKPGEKIKVTLSWVDPAAVYLPSVMDRVDDTSSKLVNDFDLRIIDMQTNQVYYPWKLDLSDVTGAAVKGDNLVDNIEQITINNPVINRQYKIVISNKGTLVNSFGQPSNQDYTVLITGGSEQVLSNNNETIKSKIFVYPTLTDEIVNIETDLIIENVNVLDITGKLIYRTMEKQINISHFSSGVYILDITTNEGKLTQKIVRK